MTLALEIASAVGWGLVVAGVGGALTRLDSWYDGLKRPKLQPPDWAFGPAWTVILALAATSALLAWRNAPDDAARMLVVALFGVNGALNILWNLLFFTRKRPDHALVEVVFLWLSILAAVVTFRTFSPVSSWLLAPYLVWVGFASYLNLEIVRLNGPFGARADKTIPRV
ncbi:TspO/MBR-related protein [Methylopila turkensis]|uniref:TspO/MBR-related protein n=1 Tax=Methylopila turkensis TaxID=1437816 RepID=A0A9W6JIJ4_9HYPH|nr:TspO/MBR-related protein [Methylopila turkensis]